MAARLDRNSVLLFAQKMEDYTEFIYVGRTKAIPNYTIEVEDRRQLPTWKATEMKIQVDSKVAFAVRTRKGLLHPHNWDKTTKPKERRCPLCKKEIYVNHSVTCPKPGDRGSMMPIWSDLCAPITKGSNRQRVRYFEEGKSNAVEEQLTRGILPGGGKEIVPLTEWVKIWKRTMGTMQERHKDYWSEVIARGLKGIETFPEKPPTAWEIKEGGNKEHRPEQLYIKIKQGTIPREWKRWWEPTHITERQARHLVQKIIDKTGTEQEEEETDWESEEI